MSRKATNFRRFLTYVKPYRHYVILGALGGIVKFTLPLLVPLVIEHLIDEVFRSETLSADQKMREMLWWVGGMMAVFVFFYTPWVFVRHYFASKAGHSCVFDLRCSLYDSILRMSSSFFRRNKCGEIVSRLISDIQLTQNLVGNALTNVWMDAAAILVVLGLLLSKNVGITIVALATFPLYIYFFRRLQGKIRNASYMVQQETATLSGNVSEKIAGNAVVHAFTQEQRENSLFHTDSERIYKQAMRTQLYQSLNMMITGTLMNLAPLIVMLYGGYQVITGRLEVGELVAVIMWLTPLYMPLQRFSELNIIFANAMAALDRIFEVMDQESEIRDKPEALPVDGIEGRVAFENVHFGYEEDKPVLRGIDFVAEPDTKVALVGPSGSGKSTLVGLIPRFYDVHAGAIRIDGDDIRDLRLKDLRRHIAMVLQDPVLFSGNILDNIRYGAPEANMDEILAACEAANALQFIEETPNGFDTEVGERGDFLSGGQKQRITIARAFLKDPEILILDEPTSALDVESEHLIQEALERLMEGKTTFIIAHRLSTIVNADTILVLDNGRIVEKGSHQDLLRGGELYKGLYEQQFRLVRSSMDIMEAV